MKEVIVIAIWDKTESDVMTRSVIISKDTKQLKLNGKKPNKVIIPESLTDKRLLKKIKGIGTYKCQIIRAIGR